MTNQNPIWKKIKILHNRANELMKKQSILDVNLRIKFKELAKKNPKTKIFKTIKTRISKMQTKHRELSAEITATLRKKDSLLKKIK